MLETKRGGEGGRFRQKSPPKLRGESSGVYLALVPVLELVLVPLVLQVPCLERFAEGCSRKFILVRRHTNLKPNQHGKDAAKAKCKLCYRVGFSSCTLLD